MSESQVKHIYETLSAVEAKAHPRTPYPIHKTLNFGTENQWKDVYDWIFDNVRLPRSGRILDVGCGVGYGSFYLCAKTDCTSLGISLSESEIQIAREIANHRAEGNRCAFLVQSFDQPLEEKFDLIIAVESLIHAEDLPKTLMSLMQMLKVGGKCLIISDIFRDSAPSYFLKHLQLDWYLKSAWTIEDYLRPLSANLNAVVVKHDLTKYVIMRNRALLWYRFLVSHFRSFCGKVVGKETVWPIMRGGVALEFLYQKRLVEYQLIEFTLEA